MSVEQRGPAVCRFSFNQEGKDEMIKACIDLQDLRRRIYVKAKADTSWRFWGLYVHICKIETLHAAYAMAKNNDGAPGVDGGHLCGHRTARRGSIPRADQGRTRSAHLCAATSRAAGNSDGWRESPRTFQSFDPGSGGAGCAQAHPGAHL